MRKYNNQKKPLYIHVLTIKVNKNCDADTVFDKHLLNKNKVEILHLPNLKLPLNKKDYLNIKVVEKQSDEIGNTYILEVKTNLGSDTYKYIEENK